MLKPVTGDILLTRAQAIAHGIAPHDDFKQGLALALRERFPAMVKDFRHYSSAHNPKPGTAWIWGGVDGDGRTVRIINLLTQEPPAAAGKHPGKATLANLNHALHELKKLIVTEKLTSLALPRLATGVGGLDWKDVHPLLHKVLDDVSIPIYVYATYKPGVVANEAQ